MSYLNASDHPERFVPHGFEEHLVDLGEVRLNYATAGSPDHPAILLISASSGRATHFCRCVVSAPFDKKNGTERSVAPLRDQGLVRTGQFDAPVGRHSP